MIGATLGGLGRSVIGDVANKYMGLPEKRELENAYNILQVTSDTQDRVIQAVYKKLHEVNAQSDDPQAKIFLVKLEEAYKIIQKHRTTDT